MQSFTSPEQALTALTEHLRTLYKPYAGARFGFAFAPHEGHMKFLTACVTFRIEPISPRPIANYKKLLFVEHWCQGQEESLLLLRKVLSGQAEIGGRKIDSTFSTSNLDHHTYPTPPDYWARWELKSTIDRDPSWQDIYLPQGTLSGIGLPTYLGPSEAINDRIFGLETFNNLGSDVPYKDYVVTVLPDTRARFLSAEWLPGSLRLEVEINIPKDNLRLEVRHINSRKRSQTVPLDTPQVVVPVPEDTTGLLICLIDQAGEVMSQVGLQSVRDTFGKARANLKILPRAGGEFGAEDSDITELIARNSIPAFPASNQDIATRFDNISLEQAYRHVHDWYKSNVDRANDLANNSSARIWSKDFIQNSLNDPLTNLEMRAVLQEVLEGGGLLSWGKDQSDGAYRMEHYARAGLLASGTVGRSQVEDDALKRASPGFFRALRREYHLDSEEQRADGHAIWDSAARFEHVFAASSFTPRCMRVLVAAAGYTRNRREATKDSLGTGPLLFALIDFAILGKIDTDDASRVIREKVEQSVYQEIRRQYFKTDLPGDLPVTIFDGEPLSVALETPSHNSQTLLIKARQIAERTLVLKSPIDVRHLIAASLTAFPANFPAGVTQLYEELDMEIGGLKRSLFSFIDRHFGSTDFLHEWHAILGVSAQDSGVTSQAIDSASKLVIRQDWLAGITSDRSREQEQDLLNIRKEVHALCSVIAAEDAALPLSIGLFGEWGSGKSFFMKEMEKEIKRLTLRGSPYCSNIVQLKFNAWHYIDTSLWASLTSEIFEGLATTISQSSGISSEDATARILADLATSQDKLADAERKKRQAEAELADSEQRLKKLEPQLFIGAAMRLAVQQKEVKEKLVAAAQELNLPQVGNASLAVEDQLLQLRGIGSALLVAIRNTASLWVWLFALGLVIASVVMTYEWLLPWAERTRIPGFFSRVAGILLGVAGLIGPFVPKARRALQFVQEASKRGAAIIKEKQEEKQKQVEEEQRRVEVARTKVKEFKRQLEELRADRQMLDFIRKRNESTDYTSHLGVIARSHRDFRELSTFFERMKDQPRQDHIPRVDRIILYIDDLDRCPEDKVMDVLQAVHLLLAFPLFVVVVGVDPRWLLHAVSEHSSAFRHTDNSNALASTSAPAMWQSTPLNYLEKIFQIPFTLTPMTDAGYDRIVDELTREKKQKNKQTEAASSEPPASHVVEAVPRDIEFATDKASPVAHAAPITQQSRQNTSSNDEETSGPQSTPEPLRIEEWEREYMKKLYSLILSPRAGKRFINLYRLIRATVEPQKWETFVGNERGGEHRPVLMLLAILIGYPSAAADLLKELIERDHSEPWWRFVDDFEKRRSGSVHDPHDQELLGKLRSLRPLIPANESCRVFQEYAPEVARYSFQSGRVLLALRRIKQIG